MQRFFILAGAIALVMLAASGPAGSRALQQSPEDNRPLSHDEVVALADRAIANQHRSDHGQLADENLLRTRRLVRITWAGDGDCVPLRPP